MIDFSELPQYLLASLPWHFPLSVLEKSSLFSSRRRMGVGGQTKQPLPFPPAPSPVYTVLRVTRGWPSHVFFFFNKAPPWGLHLCTHCLDCAPFIGASVAAIYTSSVTLRRNFPYVRCVISPSSVRREERTELLSFTQTRAYRM